VTSIGYHLSPRLPKYLPSAFQPHSVDPHLSQELRHPLYTFITPPGIPQIGGSGAKSSRVKVGD